jgi:hypothetical protein
MEGKLLLYKREGSGMDSSLSTIAFLCYLITPHKLWSIFSMTVLVQEIVGKAFDYVIIGRFQWYVLDMLLLNMSFNQVEELLD